MPGLDFRIWCESYSSNKDSDSDARWPESHCPALPFPADTRKVTEPLCAFVSPFVSGVDSAVEELYVTR